MARSAKFLFFKCPTCAALYQVVKAVAGPDTVHSETGCRVCGTPLAPRDGALVLKYFLLRKARRPGGWHRRRRVTRTVNPAGS